MILNQYLKKFLERNGFSVRMFPHGEACLQAMESGELPDLILMDINLGRKHLDGPTVTRKIYQRYDVPVVLHSAYTDKETLDGTRDMTKYGYIQKVPGNEEFVLATIDMAFKLFAQRRALSESVNRYRELLRHQQNLLEEQNAHIAKEVHDQLGQSLTSLQMGLSLLETNMHNGEGSRPGSREKARELIEEMRRTIDATVTETRELAWRLKPTVLDSAGILEAVEWQVREFEEKFKIPTRFSKQGVDSALDKDRSLAVYRIVQEAMTNCARRAEAEVIEVQARMSPQWVELRIVDDGQGFDYQGRMSQRSFGLIGMQERAIQFGGAVQIETSPGSGTRVLCRIPRS